MFIFLSIESNRFFTSTAHVTSKLFSGGSIYKPDKFLNYKQSDIIIIEDDLFGKRRNITENIYNDESLQLGKPKSSGFTTEHIPEKYKAARTNFKREMDSTIRNYTFSKKYFNTRRDNFRHNDSIQSHGIFICPSEMEYARPKRGRSVSGEWKDIVNVEEYTQTLRMEKCLEPLSSCNYVSHHFKSECSQVYNYHRLLSWNKERGLHMDIFKVPTCCSCNMKGYSYLYPPLIRNFNKSQRQIHNKKKNSGKSKEPLGIKNKNTSNSRPFILSNDLLRKKRKYQNHKIDKKGPTTFHITSVFTRKARLQRKTYIDNKLQPSSNYKFF
ncbi:Neurotrophin 1 [Lepeophtheirus salmonis]|uniref:Neurotrophin 1 n=1 Tax=Lepeophtheirus salmonis TaxID=72036 RepID=A0A7R8CGR5_LEPSM|nr:Neurotrophin 1 [Lepeophtheirus salmonis]CAF2818304.1 Neurotrophin 1 [Lepeophtheirus salmonis]